MGVTIPDYPSICEKRPDLCRSGDGVHDRHLVPEIVSQDGQVNVRLWLDLTASAVKGIDRKTGKVRHFVHACGYKKQWTVVIDRSGKMSLFESEHGLSCPSSFESDDAPAIVI